MRLIDIEKLKGCAIVRPHTHEDIMAIESCSEKIVHKDIPTAFDINNVIKEIRDESFEVQVDAIPGTSFNGILTDDVISIINENVKGDKNEIN